MSENLLSLAQKHRAIAKEFTEKVDRARNWDAPSPVEGWTARDVVRHLVEWPRQLFGQAEGVTFGEVPSVDDDPKAAWHAHNDEMQALLEDPATDQVQLSGEHFGDQPLSQAIESFYVPDVFMHTWDLARATGQNADLDPVVAEAMLKGMEEQEEMLRASGQFGTRREVRPGAGPEDRLVAFIGRDPYWRAEG